MKLVRLLLSASLLLLASRLLPAQQPTPSLVLEGDVTPDQNRTHFFVPFKVPVGVHRITVDFSYTHREEKTTLNIGIHDPNGFRGQSGSNKDHFTIGPGDATASYIPGSIPPGEWKLLISVSSIRPNITSHYRAEIRFNSPLEDSSFTLTPLDTHARWFRGDLHMHTAHSDGSCPNQSGVRVPCPLFLTAQAAANRGLDFIAISDHNSLAHYAEMRELQPYFSKMLLIPGREMTTFYGHFNAFGITQYVDYRVAEKGGRTIDQVVADILAQGGIVSINHPMSPTDERCRGCGWTPPTPTDLSKFAGVEVVNANRVMDRFWDEQIAQGHRLTAIGGSDNHSSPYGDDIPTAIGHPTTAVMAQDLSVASILAGIRAGHVFIDLAGSRNRLLEIEAHTSKTSAHMGDTLRAENGEQVELTIHVAGCNGSQLKMFVDGKAAGNPQTLSADDATPGFHWTGIEGRHWLRFVVVDANDTTQMLSNPIYINF
ncbi:CehA/McbA family metallohydrolase [Granulicella sp. dw_53]|uniref:CehA/McbA family metallohydrolase n=1 Tax=Granulicella sp. dw_53 TaxID=2719792 RepID=UPI001BD64DC8|nr:CehA/McbA family metallohydrolase [Granulicella sp. dw_53]